MLLSAVLLSGCGPDDSGSAKRGAGESPNKQATRQPEQETGENTSWSSENSEVKITPVKENDTGGDEIVTVEANGVKKEFNWRFSTINDPRVFYTDVTGDGKPEAVIILNIGKGTGLSIDELHVLSSEDLSEIKVQNYEEIVADQIETHVAKNDDGTLAIKVKTQGKEYDFNRNIELPPNLKQDELGFGGVVYYKLENQKITSRLGASVGISPQYVCDIHIVYRFDKEKNEFIADQIKAVDVGE